MHFISLACALFGIASAAPVLPSANAALAHGPSHPNLPTVQVTNLQFVKIAPQKIELVGVAVQVGAAHTICRPNYSFSGPAKAPHIACRDRNVTFNIVHTGGTRGERVIKVTYTADSSQLHKKLAATIAFPESAEVADKSISHREVRHPWHSVYP